MDPNIGVENRKYYSQKHAFCKRSSPESVLRKRYNFYQLCTRDTIPVPYAASCFYRSEENGSENHACVTLFKKCSGC